MIQQHEICNTVGRNPYARQIRVLTLYTMYVKNTLEKRIFIVVSHHLQQYTQLNMVALNFFKSFYCQFINYFSDRFFLANKAMKGKTPSVAFLYSLLSQMQQVICIRSLLGSSRSVYVQLPRSCAGMIRCLFAKFYNCSMCSLRYHRDPQILV